METEAATTGPQRQSTVRQRLAGLRLRFPDRAFEAAFRKDRFQLNLGNVRFAFLVGIGLWVGWGFLLRPYMLSVDDRQLDQWIRFGVFIPLLLIGYAFSYTRLFGRIWEPFSAGIAIVTLAVWVVYSANIITLPLEYGYVGVILITAFTYALIRLRFVFVMTVTLFGIAAYLPYVFSARYVVEVTQVLATLYLVSFGFLGAFAAYWMERFARELFVRERELDQERTRSDGLLLNILPAAVIERLKTSSGERIAQAFESVTVVFIDAVGSTEQAARTTPELFAESLDELFRSLDVIADRHGIEKIKTIGDAYMAVAGAPVPMDDHAEAAVAMAAEIRLAQAELRWPSGDPITIRGGVATGPVVAGVIGERKFAYDVWGDTVNLASRLEEGARPGEVLVSVPTATEAVTGRFSLGPAQLIDLKGKGLTPAHPLLGPNATEPS